MKHYEVVCAIIENEKGEIFLCQRGKGRALEDKWEFPGGKIEENETHEETIVREIKEELDSVIQPIEYLGKSDYEYKNLGSYSDFSITLYGYRCKLIQGSLKLSEHKASKWLSKEELSTMDLAEADKFFL